MRLDFNALWVDDQPRSIDSLIERIDLEMGREGFHFNPTKCTSLQDVRARIADDVFKDQIDLIIVDWDLGGGAHGDDAIALVRQDIRYKDVIFYSALSRVDQLERVAAEKHLEGIFCSDRNGLVTQVLGIFESLIKKVLDIDHTRGIVMGATSDIDRIVNDCIASVHRQLDNASQQELVAVVFARIEKRMDEFAKRIDKLKKSNKLDPIMKATAIFTAMDRLDVLAKILEHEKFKRHHQARETLRVYREGGIKGRNELGHVVLVAADRPRMATTMEGIEVSLEEMRKLRQLILGSREQFRILLHELEAAAAAATRGTPTQ